MKPIPLTSKARVGSAKMRPLVIDADAQAAIRKVRDYAEHPECVYRPSPGVLPPGDDAAHCCIINTYRMVYSVTEAQGHRFRHLSISVPGKHYPNEFAVLMLSREFGFPGWNGTDGKFPSSWKIGLNKDEHCVVVVCELEAVK
jgi:hypothetical protein